MSAESTTKYWSRGQLESASSCQACGSKKKRKIFERRNNEGNISDIWRMVQCEDCQSIWLDPRPDSHSLPRAYDDYYTHYAEAEGGVQAGGNGVAWQLIHGYLNRRFGMRREPSLNIGHVIFSLIEPWRLKLDYYGRHLTRNRVGAPGRLLDIGCGNGAFLNLAVDMGWQACGCEVDPKAVEACRGIGLNVVEGDAFHSSLNGQFFDVITMRHVIEHVTDQPLLLRRAFDLLRPGGWLWLALPNPKSIGLKVFGAAWNALHPPCHLCIPSQAILTKWLQEQGFSDIENLRRGAHAKSEWRLSQPIARRESIAIPPSVYRAAMHLFADVLATISPHWSEESVILARKPIRPDMVSQCSPQ